VTKHLESAAQAKRLLTDALVIVAEMPDESLLTQVADHIFLAAELLGHWQRRTSRASDTEPAPPPSDPESAE
jgi:hypothetical protein